MTVPAELKTALSDRYELERELGRGGMATVYLAADRQHARSVAIKVLTPGLTAGEAGAERFHREIRVAANLVHPGIVPLFDSGECNGHLYYVMPFIDSETLGDRLSRDRRLSIEDAVQITSSVARALDYAHRRGIVHRDIKPANVFLHEGEALLADFGVARAVSSIGLESNMTTPGFALGTPSYMSPEQALGERDIDGRSDQYSLACVMFEMLAGRPPFASEQTRQVIMRHIMDPAPSIRQYRPDVPQAVDAALVRAMAKDPAARFPSINEFAAALRSRNTVEVQVKDGAHSVAVLPFVTVGAESDTEYLSDGLTDELITALARVNGLRVASRTSAFAYKGKATDVRRIGSELQVADVIEGTVRRSGNRLRVTARLTSTADGAHRSVLRFDRDTDDLFALEDELSSAIVEQLRPKLLPTSTHVTARRYTDNAAAHRLYLQGRFAWNKRTYEDTAEAIKFFEAAIAEDPTYALAYSGLSDAHALQLDYRNVAVDEGMARAKEYARKALELDDELAEAHASLGWVLFIHDWEWHESLRHFERAVALAPSYATAHQWYSFPLVALGQFDRAIAEVQLAVEYDPASVSVRRSRGGVAYYARRYEESITLLDRALEMNPISEETHRALGFSYYHLGQLDRAERSFREGLLYTPESAYSLAGLAGTLQRMGRTRESEELQRELERRSQVGYVSSAAFVMLHGLLGNVDLAVDWLEKARAERRGFVAYIAVNPTLDPLRESPRFTAMLAALGLDRVPVPA
jgi:serine/threonine-protein kinase